MTHLHIITKVTMSTTTRARFIILGMFIIVWWDFSRGGAIFRFQMGNKKKTKNYANLRGSETMKTWFNTRYECPEKEAYFIFYHVTLSLPLTLPPLPQTHPGTDALSQHGTVTHKSCSPPLTFFKWVSRVVSTSSVYYTRTNTTK